MEPLQYPIPAYQQAVQLLRACYQSIDGEYRQRQRIKLWTQVEEKVRMAANTSPTVMRWVQTFLTFPHTEIRDPLAVVEVIQAADLHREVLRIFREEPGVVVAFVRVEIEQARTEREERTA